MPTRTTADLGACTEREITEPVTLCGADGSLNPDAVGWSRTPLHDCALTGWGRNKRWDYWCVTTDDFLLSLTYSSIDFLSILNIWFLEYATERVVSMDMATPAAVGVHLPDAVGGGDMTFTGMGMRLGITEEPEGTRLGASCRVKGGGRLDADVLVALPPGHETLSVLVPWSDRVFQFTSKHNTRPATGTVRIGDETLELGEHNHAFGCLDFGRGRWPHRINWNWGSASGHSDGHLVGLQLGGTWTDGTGSTENALCIDGRLHKISEDLVWEYSRHDWLRPWHITTPRSQRVDLTFTPFYEKPSKVSIGVAGTEVHQCFGHYSGTVHTDLHDAIEVERVLGWAEEARMVW